MAQLKVPEQPRVQTTSYSNLLGVDYQSDATEVSRHRSPEMVNMISDSGGNPVKRYGYRDLGRSYDAVFEYDGSVFGLRVGLDSDNASTFFAVFKLEFTSSGGITETNITGSMFWHFTDEFSNAVVIGDYLCVFFEHRWVQINMRSSDHPQVVVGGECHIDQYDKVEFRIPDESIIPTVYTMYKPKGNEMVALPEGTDITNSTRGVNILTPFRRAEYCIQVDTAMDGSFPLSGVSLPLGQTCATNAKYEILDKETFEWVDATDRYKLIVGYADPAPVRYMLLPDESGDYKEWYRQSCSFSNGADPPQWFPPYVPVDVDGVAHLRFANGDGTASAIDVPEGIPNFRITYAPMDMTIVGDADGTNKIIRGAYNEERIKVFKSKIMEAYDGRLWVAVGNRAYYSRVNEPFCIDDNYYIEIDSNITAFAKTSGGLAVIGEGNHPMYVVSGGYNDTYGMPVYTIKASNANVTIASSNCHDTLNDEPMLITKNGIYGLTTNYYSEKYSIMRSGKINKRLCAESGLSSAVAVAHQNYLWVAVGSHMYVLDGRHKDTSRSGDNSYESYYFEGLPDIKKMWVVGDKMLFSDGSSTYTWNDDLPEDGRYVDGLEWDSTNSEWRNGKPVKALWKSALDGDGVPHYYKTLQKKGTMVTVAPPMQTGCQVTLVRDAHDKIYVGRFSGDTFSLTDAVLDAFTKKKVKKYKRLQFVIENNEAEPFGIISIVKSYILNNYAKR